MTSRKTVRMSSAGPVCMRHAPRTTGSLVVRWPAGRWITRVGSSPTAGEVGRDDAPVALPAGAGDLAELEALVVPARLADPAHAGLARSHRRDDGVGDLARRHQRESGRLEALLGLLADERRVDDARADCVDRHAERLQLR